MKGKDPKKAVRIATLATAIGDQGAILGLCGREPGPTLARIQEMKIARAGIDRAEVNALVAERGQARAAKDFARADLVRGRLSELGVQLMYTAEGTRWKVI